MCDKSQEATTCLESSLQDFVLAFNACESPKQALRLIQDGSKAYTACVSVRSDILQVSCTSLAGVLQEDFSVPIDANIDSLADKLRCRICDDEMALTCFTFLSEDGNDVDISEFLKDHTTLTVKASLSPDDVGRLLYRAEGIISVEFLGQCLGNHGDFWKKLAVSYPENFTCFAGLGVVEAIRAYLWRFRLPGEAAQIERIIDGFARAYFHFNKAVGTAVIDDDKGQTEAKSEEAVQSQSCWDQCASGWYVQQPLSGPKLLPCCVHCGALDGEVGDLMACGGCNVIHFCRKCRTRASFCGHAVVGQIGYGRACVAARNAVGSLGPDHTITYSRGMGGEKETAAVSEKSLNWVPVSPFKNEDAVMVLAYAIIMLTTNLHSANVKEKMKKHEFIKQNREVNGNGNFPGDFLSKVYDDMLREELKVMRKVDRAAGCSGFVRSGI